MSESQQLPRPRFSIITCTHRPDYYRQNVVATLEGSESLCELIEVDNRNNRLSVPAALNEGRERARGEFLVFCHHDVRFPPAWIERLGERLDDLGRTDPDWAVAGLVGRSLDGRWIGNILDDNIPGKLGDLPCEVQSLDEVCLILRSDSPISFDESLASMHFYGADLCLQARILQQRCYVVDAPVEHLSTGTRSPDFFVAANAMLKKWSKIEGSPHVIFTTCGSFKLKHTPQAYYLVARRRFQSKSRRAWRLIRSKFARCR